MSQPNPYDSPEETAIQTPSDDAQTSNGILARAIEYLIAILLIIALIFAFIQGII